MNLLVGFCHCVADCNSRKGRRCFLASLLGLAGDTNIKKKAGWGGERGAGWLGCSGRLGGYRNEAASWLAGVVQGLACWGGCKVGLLEWLQGWLVGVAARLACGGSCNVGLLGWLQGWLVGVAARLACWGGRVVGSQHGWVVSILTARR